jgi:putative nucleotidyltransferase with HDIG domain
MAMQMTFLRSKVARRIFVLFVGCALLPIVALTVLSFYEVSNQLKNESQKQLQQSTRAEGFAVYERLSFLDNELQAASLRVNQQTPQGASIDIGNHLQGAMVVKKEPESLLLFGSATFMVNAKLHLRSGKTLIKTGACPGPGTGFCIAMMRLIDAKHPESGMLVGQIDPAYLSAVDQMPTGYTACVLDSVSRPLYCSGAEKPPNIGASGPSHDFSGFFQWAGNKARYDASFWSLLLKPRFAADPWTIVLSRNHEDTLAPMEHFRSVFPFVIALAVWIVVLFSLIQIRRTLVPLEKLREATTQIGERRFDNRVEINSRDEFEDLANAFNVMSAKLGKQFRALATVNEIDHAILASLNREGIVEAVLDGMVSLLPCDCCGIALFEEEDENDSVSVSITMRTADAVQRSAVQDLQVAPSDLRQLRQTLDVQVLYEQDRVPQFLGPFAERGMRAFLVVPVSLDQKLLAAIVCAHITMPSRRKDDFEHARRVADQLAVAFYNVQLIEAHEELHWGALTALARAIDASSPWTGGHSERVTELAVNIGRAMGLSPGELLILHRGGLLHDVGKIGTPPGILEKPGKLDSEELKVMRDHVRMGVRILEPIPSFKQELLIVAQHHEWFDGSGYPAGLAGEGISLFGRIFAVADCFDALTSDRPYRKGMPKDKALELLQKESGTHFDPTVIAAFERLLAKGEGLESVQLQGQGLIGQLT